MIFFLILILIQNCDTVSASTFSKLKWCYDNYPVRVSVVWNCQSSNWMKILFGLIFEMLEDPPLSTCFFRPSRGSPFTWSTFSIFFLWGWFHDAKIYYQPNTQNSSSNIKIVRNVWDGLFMSTCNIIIHILRLHSRNKEKSVHESFITDSLNFNHNLKYIDKHGLTHISREVNWNDKKVINGRIKIQKLQITNWTRFDGNI